jgi:protein-S-isoprenylcysteine O-methyltransferase Ste14
MWFRWWSLLGFVAMAGGFVALLVDGRLLSLDPVVIAAQCAAVALIISARRYLGLRSFHIGAEPTRGRLVMQGPYRVIRHPIYTGVYLFIWPAALSCHTLPSCTLTALVTVGAVIRMLCEERLLVKHFTEYTGYANATKRMIPRVF